MKIYYREMIFVQLNLYNFCGK